MWYMRRFVQGSWYDSKECQGPKEAEKSDPAQSEEKRERERKKKAKDAIDGLQYGRRLGNNLIGGSGRFHVSIFIEGRAQRSS
jgi:hypothetical protein